MARTDFEIRKHAGRPMIAATDFTYAGEAFKKGDPFPTDQIDARRVQTMHSARRIDFATDPRQEARNALAERRADLLAQPSESPVELTAQPGGYYLITAPWVAEPIRIRGKANAEAEAERLRAEGPPLGFIAGGSPVTVEGGEGGWFDVSAPWLPAPEKVQGRDLAETRQLELHQAGEPATWNGITLEAGENGWFTISRDGQEETLKVQGEEQAREAAAKLRAGETVEGQPESWTATPEADPIKVGDVVIVGEDAGDLAGLRATVEQIDGDNAEVLGFAAGDQSDGSDLKRGTVPLASLTVSPPEASNEGEQNDEQA